MKNARLIKTFLIIGMVFSFYLIFPVVLGVKAINKIETTKDKEEIRKWGIIALFFVNTLAGILILTSNNNEIRNTNTTKRLLESPESLLIELKNLYDQGIIDHDFYELKRKEYIDRI